MYALDKDKVKLAVKKSIYPGDESRVKTKHFRTVLMAINYGTPNMSPNDIVKYLIKKVTR